MDTAIDKEQCTTGDVAGAEIACDGGREQGRAIKDGNSSLHIRPVSGCDANLHSSQTHIQTDCRAIWNGKYTAITTRI